MGFNSDQPRDSRGRWAGDTSHWFKQDYRDPHVYHGTTVAHLEGIKKEGISAFLRTYFATDPKIAMQYAFRSNIHHSERGRGKGGVLLRVLKEHVDPELAQSRSRVVPDFVTGPDVISPDKIEMRQQGKWVKLSDVSSPSSEVHDPATIQYLAARPEAGAGITTAARAAEVLKGTPEKTVMLGDQAYSLQSDKWKK